MYLYINYITLFNYLLVIFIIAEFILMFNNWIVKDKNYYICSIFEIFYIQQS